MELVKANTPQIDRRLGEGLAYDASKDIAGYVDQIFRINSASFPKGLDYLGYEKATPMEGFKYMTRVATSNTRRYDINKNDIRLVNFIFRYQGEIYKKQIYLPFIRRFGFMFMNGVKYVVSPVVSDGTITVKPTSIFVKLIKAKLWFERFIHLVVIDGKPEYIPVYWSQVYNKRPTEEQGVRYIKMYPTLILYLFSKFGMDKTIEFLGYRNRVLVLDKQEFLNNQHSYPEKDWVVMESSGKKPPRSYLFRQYEPLTYVFLINRKEFENNPSSKTIFGTIIYILDHFTNTNRMNPDLVNDINSWRYMLGETICSSEEHSSVIKETVDKHMLYVDEYIDNMVHEGFARIGLPQITDIYQLFKYIIENFAPLVSGVNKISESNSIYGKQLQVLQYLLFNITKAVNGSYFELSGLRIEQEKNPRKVIKMDDIKKALNKIRTEEILRIKSHAEIMPVDDPTDLPLLKVGRMVVPQELSDKQRTSKTSFDVNDPRNVLHESLIEAGAAVDMSKADPSGHNRVNLFVKLSDDYTIIKNPELSPIMDNLKSLLYSGEMTTENL